MKIPHTLSLTLSILALVGMLLPPGVQATQPGPMPTIRDARLQTGGVLRGALVSQDGKPLPDQTVTLQRDGQVVATARTDQEGAFAAPGLRPGVYAVASDDALAVYRAWAPGTAPPSASEGVLLVRSNDPVARGGMSGEMRRTVVVGGLMVAAGVIGGVIGYNIRDVKPAS